MSDGSEFILKLNRIKLPAEAEKQIAGELQSALLAALAKIDLKAGVAFRIPKKDWFGIWIEPIPRIDGGGLPVLRVDQVRK